VDAEVEEVMDRERFQEIMEGDDILFKFDKCRTLLGLNLIAKYLPKSGVKSTTYDQIFACGVDELLEAGLTENDAIQLREMGWMIDEDSLAKFV
jgi:hypothetical protein